MYFAGVYRCVHVEQGCQDTMTVSQVADHLVTCPYIRLSEGPSLTCPQCGDPLDLESGQELDPALARHQAVVCPNTLVACSLTSLGCDQRLPRGEIQTHMETHSVHHMRLLADKMTKMQQVQLAEMVCSRQESEEEGCTSLPGTPLTREYQVGGHSILVSTYFI